MSRLRAALAWTLQEARTQTHAVDNLTGDLSVARKPGPGLHTRAVREFAELAAEAVRLAVLADRQAGASWAQVGAGLGISADAARRRYGRLRFHWAPGGPSCRHAPYRAGARPQAEVNAGEPATCTRRATSQTGPLSGPLRWLQNSSTRCFGRVDRKSR
ncbi:hypothetical protein [Spongiactinospora sp. 9N601]|uniref:hypothetical protein n=1 Tax=Spongiactinospora sp. 9N601 TaxID=3375149 RepID=UPI00379C94C2